MSNGEQLQAAINEAIRATRSLANCFQAVATALERSSPESTAALAPEMQTLDKPITVEQIRQVMRNKQGDGKINQIRELFLKYGAGRLSEVRAEDYASLLRELEAM